MHKSLILVALKYCLSLRWNWLRQPTTVSCPVWITCILVLS